MKIFIVLCIVGISVSLVCICYGVISIFLIHKKEKEETKKEMMSKHLFLSTSLLMWADLYGVKVSHIMSIEEIKHGFVAVFSKKSSDKIASLIENTVISNILEGHFEKFNDGRYRFVSNSLVSAQHDIEKLMMCCNMMSAYVTDVCGNGELGSMVTTMTTESGGR